MRFEMRRPSLRFCGLILAALLGSAIVGNAQSPIEVIEVYENGGINWTQGKIFAFGEWAPEADHFGEPVEPEKAIQVARTNLLRIIKSIRINAHTQTAHFFNERGSIFQEIHSMADSAIVTNREYLSDGSLKVGLEMGLWGGFAQLVLPGEIRQVDTVKPIDPTHQSDGDTLEAPKPDSDPSLLASRQPQVFTGLVLDARGVGLKPALVPLIRDETGREVYGPAFVSREFIVQQGMCIYAREITGIRAHPKVRYNPMVIKGRPARGEEATDLTISDTDAARLRGASEHLTFLREGRVIIVVD